MRLSATLLAMAMLVIGCAPTGSGGIDCAGWRPIFLDAATIDAMTEADAEAVLAHNRYGQRRGCW